MAKKQSTLAKKDDNIIHLKLDGSDITIPVKRQLSDKERKQVQKVKQQLDMAWGVLMPSQINLGHPDVMRLAKQNGIEKVTELSGKADADLIQHLIQQVRAHHARGDSTANAFAHAILRAKAVFTVARDNGIPIANLRDDIVDFLGIDFLKDFTARFFDPESDYWQEDEEEDEWDTMYDEYQVTPFKQNQRVLADQQHCLLNAIAEKCPTFLGSLINMVIYSDPLLEEDQEDGFQPARMGPVVSVTESAAGPIEVGTETRSRAPGRKTTRDSADAQDTSDQ